MAFARYASLLLRTVGVALALALLSASPVLAQMLRGTIRDADTGAPVAGVWVALLDPSNARVAGALTDGNGAYRIRAPGPGTFRLRAEMIGRRSVESDPVRIGTATVTVDLSLPWSPVALDAIDVAVARQCEVRPGSGGATQTVWDEARKALSIEAATRTERAYRYGIEEFERELDRARRPVSEWSRHLTRYTGIPFTSLPADRLAEDGFVERRDDGNYLYGPNAEVLLSDPFLDTHCMYLRRDPDRPGLIALVFEPVPGRKVPDIRGELWLAEATSELRALEFRYTSLPGRMVPGDYGGSATFERLPSGAWIVRDWQIRSPIAHVMPGIGSRVVSVATTGYSVTGARVLEIRDRTGTPVGAPAPRLAGATADTVRSLVAANPVVSRLLGPAHLSGSVVSDDGAPIPDVVVTVVGTDLSRVTDPKGTFRFDALPPGPVVLATEHLAWTPVLHRMQAEPGRTYDVRIRLVPHAIPLDPLNVNVTVSERLNPGYAAFLKRVEQHDGGRFILRDEIESRAQRQVTDLLVTAGVNVVGGGLYMKRLGCAPIIYLDGIKFAHYEPMDSGAPAKAFDAANILLPFEVEGIEVFPGPASLPAEFGGASGACGVVALWTRRGPPRR